MRSIAIIAALGVSGCATLRHNAVVENRFRTQSGGTDVPPVAIAVTTMPVPDEKAGVSLAQLGDRAQAALITATAGKPPLIIKSAGKDGSPPVTGLDDQVERRVIVAIRPDGFMPASDRVDAIRVKISVHNANGADGWRIINWTQAANGHDVIDVGKLSDTSSTKLSASTGVNLGALLPNAQFGIETNRSAAREAEIKDTTELSAAVDETGTAWLDEVAGWRVSLNHNLSIDTVLATARENLGERIFVSFNDLTRKLADGSTGPALPAAVSLYPTTLLTPKSDSAPICGHAELNYRIRHVTNADGQATFSESDDDVQFKTNRSETDFLFAPSPYKPSYALRFGARTIVFEARNAQPQNLVFSSIDEATAFTDWLKRAAPAGGKLGNAKVGTIGAGKVRALTTNELRTLVPALAEEKPSDLTKQLAFCAGLPRAP